MTRRSENENPEQRFKRVAAARANAILDKLRLLGNCSNRRIYKYTDKDVDRIFNTINKEIKETRLRFSTKKRDKFKL